MAELPAKVKSALDEARILVLGTQVLLGFQYRAAFEPGFRRLPEPTQYLNVGGLGLLLLAVALLIVPAAYHRIVERGRDTWRLHAFVTVVTALALLPLALGLGVDMYVAGEKIMSRRNGIIVGGVTLAVALAFWYGLEWILRVARGASPAGVGPSGEHADDEPDTPLKDRIDHVLTEARVVLPGAQALLGFQFAVLLMEEFDRLPAASKLLHVVALALLGLTAILLMTPAAYHRIVERGEDTERFHRLAGLMVLAAMVPLALAISLDLVIVVLKVTASARIAIAAGTVALAIFYGLWFAFTGWIAAGRRAAAARARSEPARARAA